jgi:membrane associated rhomboid family serine protease
MPPRAIATTVIAVVTAMIGAILLLGDYVGYAAVYAGFIPARIGDALPMLDQADLMPVAVTPFTATLIHANFLHLAFNLVMLVYTGRAAERAVGVRGIVVLYLTGAIAAVMAHYLADPSSAIPMIGASGAISAIVGAYSLLYSRNKARPVGPFSAQLVHMLWLVVAWTAINLLIGYISIDTSMPVAGAAHVGGFIAGVILVRPLVRWYWEGAR